MGANTDFLKLRDLLTGARENYDQAVAAFQWPRFETFNWATEYFDHIHTRHAGAALRFISDDGADMSVSFAEMSRRSSQVANFLLSVGIKRGDRVLLMLGNTVPLWECMLALIKVGAVIVPATTLLQKNEIGERIERGKIGAVITESAFTDRVDSTLPLVRIAVGPQVPGWTDYKNADSASDIFLPSGPTAADSDLLLYFTSGTTSRPKLVAHSHVTYPVGHLTTMYWMGLKKGDVHLNLSSPGWAKHAYSSVFAPWNAEATVLAYHYVRFNARALLDQLVRCGVTSFCAPPTVWRMLVQEPLSEWKVQLRELVSAGEPLNPEVIQQVKDAWGIEIRDGFGQTETTLIVGNTPAQRVKAGSMGRPMPGCPVVLLAADGKEADTGELCIDMKKAPVCLTKGYADDAALYAKATAGGYYRTGDIAERDTDGYLTYVGRADDVFKSSDYRISPFELESVVVEHAAVVEAAVVPSPDAIRLSVPKVYVMLAQGYEPTAATAESILAHVQARVSPYKRIRRLEFAALPKTISGKIRRVELRRAEETRDAAMQRRAHEFWEEDFPALRQAQTVG